MYGEKVGLYTSPHLHSFSERYKVNGEQISKQKIVEIANKVFEKAVEIEGLRMFDILTMVGLLYFKDQGCTWAVLETGVGGRLDATNIVTPEVSAITSIGLDHCDVLGSTVKEITGEKAGIIKPTKPVVIGPSVDLDVVIPKCTELGSDWIRVDGMNDYREENDGVAFEVISKAVDTDWMKEVDLYYRVRKVIQDTNQPCRMEMVRDGVMVDVCHNIDGFKAVFQKIKGQYSKVKVVMAISHGKDV